MLSVMQHEVFLRHHPQVNEAKFARSFDRAVREELRKTKMVNGAELELLIFDQYAPEPEFAREDRPPEPNGRNLPSSYDILSRFVRSGPDWERVLEKGGSRDVRTIRLVREPYDDPYDVPEERAVAMCLKRLDETSWDSRNPPVPFLRALRWFVIEQLSKLSDKLAAGSDVRIYTGIRTPADIRYGGDGIIVFDDNRNRTNVTFDVTLDSRKQSKSDVIVTFDDICAGIPRVANKIVKAFVDKRKRLKEESETLCPVA